MRDYAQAFLKVMVCLVLIFAGARSLRAQETAERAASDDAGRQVAAGDSPYRIRRGMNEFGVWGGGAFNATTVFGGLTEAEASGRKLLLVGLRYGRVLAASRRVALEYTIDFIPVAVAFNNIVQTDPALPATRRRANTYGIGAAPTGLKVLFGERKVKGFASVSGGFLGFTEPVPLPEATKFTFTGDADAGVQIFTGKDARRALIFGFKFHHISNAGRSETNRGLNSFVFYAGFSIFR